jgi:hypothetical protein
MPGITASGSTIYVSKDGTGDFTSIPEAMYWASYGDTVLVGPGIYTDPHVGPGGSVHLVIMKDGVTLTSELGPENTILDGEYISTLPNAAAAVAAHYTTEMEISGFTIRDNPTNGISSDHPAGFVIKNNVIVGCGVNAIGVNPVGLLIIEENDIDCPAAVYGINLSASSTSETFIRGNKIRTGSRGIELNSGAVTVVGNRILYCTRGIETKGRESIHIISHNFISHCGYGILHEGSSPAVGNNTFVSCGTGLYTIPGSGGNGGFSHNILYGCDCGTLYWPGSVSCNLFWLTGLPGATSGTDIFEDPLFCDVSVGDYRLQECSPCIHGYGCGQIGAYGVGCPCGGVSVRPTTWGGIKSMYR